MVKALRFAFGFFWGIVCLIATGEAFGGLLGPRNYDECITGAMKGVTSDVAAKAIMRSCRSRFPEVKKRVPSSRELSATEGSHLEGTADVNMGNLFRGSLYNGNSNLTITEVTVCITTKEAKKEKRRLYTTKVNIPPESASNFSFDIIPGSSKATYSWYISSAKGY